MPSWGVKPPMIRWKQCLYADTNTIRGIRGHVVTKVKRMNANIVLADIPCYGVGSGILLSFQGETMFN